MRQKGSHEFKLLDEERKMVQLANESKTRNTKGCRDKKEDKDANETANESKKEENDGHSFTFTL